ncbi:MAG: hypothetical protein WCF66_13050, partial [Pseudolabrys sp.]
VGLGGALQFGRKVELMVQPLDHVFLIAQVAALILDRGSNPAGETLGAPRRGSSGCSVARRHLS